MKRNYNRCIMVGETKAEIAYLALRDLKCKFSVTYNQGTATYRFEGSDDDWNRVYNSVRLGYLC